MDTERLEQTSQGSPDCLYLGPSFKGMRTAKARCRQNQERRALLGVFPCMGSHRRKRTDPNLSVTRMLGSSSAPNTMTEKRGQLN